MIEYNIKLGGTLMYGYQYDALANTVKFLGFQRQNESSVVYLAFHNGTDYLIPLTENLEVSIASPLTDVQGKATGQLVEISTDGQYVRNSNIFDIYVKDSIERGEETEVTSDALVLLYTQMYALYETLVATMEQLVTREEVDSIVETAISNADILMFDTAQGG